MDHVSSCFRRKSRRKCPKNSLITNTFQLQNNLHHKTLYHRRKLSLELAGTNHANTIFNCSLLGHMIICCSSSLYCELTIKRSCANVSTIFFCKSKKKFEVKCN
jgi:hypothetical protein